VLCWQPSHRSLSQVRFFFSLPLISRLSSHGLLLFFFPCPELTWTPTFRRSATGLSQKPVPGQSGFFFFFFFGPEHVTRRSLNVRYPKADFDTSSHFPWQ